VAKPLTTFTDPRLGVLTLLRDELPTYDFGTKLPRTVTDPFVLIARDFSRTRYPVDERVTIRVTVYATDSADAEALAQLCRAHLLSTKGTALIRATGALTGPLDAVDPDTGAALASFTVAVHTRPVEVGHHENGGNVAAPPLGTVTTGKEPQWLATQRT